jgi:hypothetical protein
MPQRSSHNDSTMKVLNLRCTHDHTFDGWFGSEADFQSQHARGLVTCPLCGDQDVRKLPSAPRLNLSGARAPTQLADPRPAAATGSPGTAVVPAAGQAPATRRGADLPAALVPPEVQALWLQAVQQVMANTEDVGERFAEEARRIHYGEAAERGIRGQATAQEREALADEGIEVVALPLPPGLRGPVQ